MNAARRLCACAARCSRCGAAAARAALPTAAHAAPAAPAVGAAGLLQAGSACCVVLGLIFACAWLARRFGAAALRRRRTW